MLRAEFLFLSEKPIRPWLHPGHEIGPHSPVDRLGNIIQPLLHGYASVQDDHHVDKNNSSPKNFMNLIFKLFGSKYRTIKLSLSAIQTLRKKCRWNLVGFFIPGVPFWWVPIRELYGICNTIFIKFRLVSPQIKKNRNS